jgi:hypothetical protein
MAHPGVCGKTPRKTHLQGKEGDDISLRIIKIMVAMTLSLNDSLSLAWPSSSDIMEV